MKKWKLLNSKLAFDTKWFKVRQDKVKLPNGTMLDDYYVWLENDVSLVVPLTPKKELIMVQQYKHASGQIMVEYPAGYVDQGENPEQAAKRELLEETGYSGKKFSLIGKLMNNPTKSVSNVYIYLVEGVKEMARGKEIHTEDTEEIKVLKLPIRKVLAMVKEGKIWVSSSVCATFLALERLESK
jgi:ADP-ribose pyrophosphatase